MQRTLGNPLSRSHRTHSINVDRCKVQTRTSTTKELIKIMVIIATIMALSITLMTVNRADLHLDQEVSFVTSEEEHPLYGENDNLLLPLKRVSRFLAETKNPKAADHYNKDNEICAYSAAGSYTNSTWCNNKCMDLSEDKHNCGACKKCKYTLTYCREGCVDMNFNKRQCRGCNVKCEKGQYCVYDLCNYA